MVRLDGEAAGPPGPRAGSDSALFFLRLRGDGSLPGRMCSAARDDGKAGLTIVQASAPRPHSTRSRVGCWAVVNGDPDLPPQEVAENEPRDSTRVSLHRIAGSHVPKRAHKLPLRNV